MGQDTNQVRQRRDKDTDRLRVAREIARLQVEIKELKDLLERQKSRFCTVKPAPGAPDPRLALVEEAAKMTGVGPACDAVGWSRAGFYRHRKLKADLIGRIDGGILDASHAGCEQ